MKRTKTGVRAVAKLFAMAVGFYCALIPALGRADLITVDKLDPIPRASWQGWENLQGTTYFGPECVATQSNRIDCFVGSGGVISRRSWDGSVWRDWAPVPGVVPANSVNGSYYYPLRMECVSWGPDHIDCFVRRDDGALLRRTWDGAYDHGWQNLGGNIASSPDCVSTGPRRLDCFARSAGGGLQQISFDGDAWSNWIFFPGNILEAAKPECVAYVNARIECVVVSPDFSLRHFSVRNPSRGFQFMQYPALSTTLWGTHVPRSPVCRSEPSTARLVCFATWSVSIPDGRFVESFGMWTYDAAMDNWAFSDLVSDFGQSAFSESTGRVAYDFDCVLRGDGRIDCMELVVRVLSVPLESKTRKVLLRHLAIAPNQKPSGWSNYILATAPQPTPATLGCVSWAADRLDCFAAGAGYEASPLWHAWMVPPSSPPLNPFYFNRR